ncbi:hypothetical protein H2200_001055 [Cladophialophora chaetospira]|uniref:NAD-dependent epimerase/dehydratase domain-containing protein n=1 Tax=Cladophialophora chaetospira TaxID=386627 RepID=A0AA39CNP0_9EURO|nr:hypothetical protein H2200_001055 [Cladophialophora chaetospira]
MYLSKIPRSGSRPSPIEAEGRRSRPACRQAYEAQRQQEFSGDGQKPVDRRSSMQFQPQIVPGSKILVTGVSGLLASHVADQALKAGYGVVGTVRDAGKTQRKKDRFNKEYGKILDTHQGQDVTSLHLAGLINASVRNDHILAFARPYPQYPILSLLRKLCPQRKFVDIVADQGSDLGTVANERSEEILMKAGKEGFPSLERSVQKDNGGCIVRGYNVPPQPPQNPDPEILLQQKVFNFKQKYIYKGTAAHTIIPALKPINPTRIISSVVVHPRIPRTSLQMRVWL